GEGQERPIVSVQPLLLWYLFAAQHPARLAIDGLWVNGIKASAGVLPVEAAMSLFPAIVGRNVSEELGLVTNYLDRLLVADLFELVAHYLHDVFPIGCNEDVVVNGPGADVEARTDQQPSYGPGNRSGNSRLQESASLLVAIIQG